MDTPSHDEVFVISDLHLGGEEGKQVFDESKRLAKLLKRLREHKEESNICLVVNGDFVDFLAEPSPDYFDAEGVIGKLQHIRSRFPIVFGAFTRFVQKPNRSLVLTLGNHDLELSLPWARKWLLDTLSGCNDAARGRITLAFDGAGYRCQVGNASVLCIHGNDVDDWNVTDYEELRRRGVEAHLGTSSPQWIPNAGTQIVIEFVNVMKDEGRPFIDLLKPESPRAMVPILVALEGTEVWKRLRGVAGPLARVGWRKVMVTAGLLGGEDESAASGHADEEIPIERVLAEVRQAVEQGVEPLDLIDPMVSEAPLGLSDTFRDWLMRKPKKEQLRNALEWIAKDRSFDPKHRDATLEKLDTQVGNVDFLVVGHTHLRRALRRRQGGVYLNTGTWIRLIEISRRMLLSRYFEPVFKALQSRTLHELDQITTTSGEKLVFRLPTLAHFEKKDRATRGRLCKVNHNGTFVTLPGTEYTR